MNTAIDQIINKYWEGTSTREEEILLRTYLKSSQVAEEHKPLKDLFSLYAREAEVTYPGELDLSFAESPSRVVRLWPRIVTIAASFAILFAVLFGLNTNKNISDTQYKGKYTELQDADEAYAITMEALAFLGNNYEKGTAPVSKNIGKFERTAVFDFMQ